jgi:hypothetical protein
MAAMIRLPGASTGTPAGAPGDSSQVDEKGAAGLFSIHNIESLSSKHFGSSLSAFIGGVFADGAAFNAKVRRLWIGMGTEEPDPFPRAIGAFRKMLDQAGVKYVLFESPGTAHEWLRWRRDLNDFAPRLFR